MKHSGALSMSTLKVISWNIGHRSEPWRHLLNTDADIALLQEAAAPPGEFVSRVDAQPWQTAGTGLVRAWRTAVVRLSDRVDVKWLEPKSIAEAPCREFAVSRVGTLSAAEVTLSATGETFTLLSMYGAWENPLSSTKSSWIYADASVHRLISDLSVFVGQEKRHRVIAAGDLNILLGHGENGSRYWANRYQTVFDRMDAIGIPFVGPQAPGGGIQALPWPPELPQDSRNVPTFRKRQADPASATRQLDFVFASRLILPRLRVRASNGLEEWGPSDHCGLEIQVR